MWLVDDFLVMCVDRGDVDWMAVKRVIVMNRRHRWWISHFHPRFEDVF